jgi:hypothetical protein
MVAWRWAEPCSRARAGVAGKLVGRGEPRARTARAGDELGAESPVMPVILVIIMASCWARKPERWWRPVRRSRRAAVELKRCWVRRAISKSPLVQQEGPHGGRSVMPCPSTV